MERLKLSSKQLKQRDNKIKALKAKKIPYKEIAKEFSLTVERVRQICNYSDTFASALRQVEARYQKKFNNHMTSNDILKDIKELSSQKRDKLSVRKRDYLIKFLYNELHLPFTRIGVLLNRDHTSIMHSYYKD